MTVWFVVLSYLYLLFSTRILSYLKIKVIVTRKIAYLCIHVECAIGCIKLFNIITHVVPLILIPHLEHVWGVCCALTLFHPPLVSSDE